MVEKRRIEQDTARQAVLLERTEVLIAAVTRRLGAPWPREAIAKIPDGQFTEAENFLMGFQQRANRKAMQEDMAALAQAEADGPATPDT